MAAEVSDRPQTRDSRGAIWIRRSAVEHDRAVLMRVAVECLPRNDLVRPCAARHLPELPELPEAAGGRAVSRRTYLREGCILTPTDGLGRKTYKVSRDDKVLGFVGTYMHSLERRTPGKRYVNSRWQSERWWSHPAGKRRAYLAFGTLGEAVRWITRTEES